MDIKSGPQGERRVLYIFLDEAGNLDFSPSGTRHFILTSLTKERPFEAYKRLCELKYDLIESGTEIEYFHAAEDRQAVRNSVFEIINDHLDETKLDSLIVDKKRTPPALQYAERFYPEMLGALLGLVIKGFDVRLLKKVVVFTDNLPLQRKRKAIEKAIKLALAHQLPQGVTHQIFHHASKSNFDLQIVDYCSWAVFRKWEQADPRSYEVIKRVMDKEFEIFKEGI